MIQKLFRLYNLMKAACYQTGQRCDILVDEYDKSLLDMVDNPEQQEHNKSVFKGFFGNLKSCDTALKRLTPAAKMRSAMITRSRTVTTTATGTSLGLRVTLQ